MNKHLSVFDLDHTLLMVNSSLRFGFYLYRKHYFSTFFLFSSLIDYVRHKLFGMSIERLHQKVFDRLLQGRCLVELTSHIENFIEEELLHLFYQPVLDCLHRAQELGHYTAIVSGSPDLLVKPISEYLQVNYWNATHYGQNDQGQLRAVVSIMSGQDKARYVLSLMKQLEIPPSALTVYSDSYLDLPILNIAGQPVGVVPDARLRKCCIKNGWKIIDV